MDGQDEMSGRISGSYSILRKQINPTKKALSLPSSPHEFQGQTSERRKCAQFLNAGVPTSAWTRVLHSSPFLNKPLLPFKEWNIDFSELTVGARVGIGKYFSQFAVFFNIKSSAKHHDTLSLSVLMINFGGSYQYNLE